MTRAVAIALMGVAAGCGRISFDALDGGPDDGVGACAIQQIAVGERHVCALRGDGAVLCAGDNAQAQLGTGMISGAEASPVHARAWASVAPADVRSIHAGREFTCVVDTAGQAQCLGANDNAALGQALPGAVNVAPVSVSSPPLKELSLGSQFACGITTSDEVWCWGDGDEGQGGNGTQPDWHVPEKLPAISGMGVVSIGTGSEHACAADVFGTISCWGAGTLNRLGYTATETCTMATVGAIPCQTTAQSVGFNNAQIATVGHEHTCMSTLAGGQVLCWGNNDQGQAGAAPATQVTSTLVGGASFGGVIELKAGRHHTCAIVDQGRVVCWGSATLLDIGRAGADNPDPVEVSLPRPAVRLAGHSMSRTTCALFDDGTASCWGANDFGQLGRGVQSAGGLPAPFTVPCD